MTTYIESTLGADERIFHTTRISLWSLAPLILLGIVTLPIIVGLFILGVVFVRYRSTEIAVTNRRIVVKLGFISRRTIEINVSKVESVQVTQGVLGRLFNFGTLVIAGTGATHEPLQGIADPIGFRRACMNAQAEANAKVGA
jgi:uncharacterized membrane protein YdbT with pleckstrin-like domain